MDEILSNIVRIIAYGFALGLPAFLGLFVALVVWSKWDYEWRDKWAERKKKK